MINRRGFIASGIAATGAVCFGALPALAQVPSLEFFTAGQGSGFLPYGEGVAKLVNAQGKVMLNVMQSKGSIENLQMVEGSAQRIGTAFIGSAYEAIQGIGPFKDKKHTNIRAIAPMYETSFQIVAKVTSGISSVPQLAGKKVGVGPAGGPAEAFFKGLQEVSNLSLTIVNGTSAELEAAYLKGDIDAFWQGASIPIPALVRVANVTDSVVFGLTANEVQLMLKRFPYLAAGQVAAGTYKGQAGLISTVAAWNVIVAHAGLDEAVAYNLTKSILTVEGLAAATNGAGASTKAANAPNNKVVPWHPGAARYLKEAGIAL
ncbi:MAG: TAXI family TRAP transporter solute-binding subunit [Beijerinckiaceae bacterium]